MFRLWFLKFAPLDQRFIFFCFLFSLLNAHAISLVSRSEVIIFVFFNILNNYIYDIMTQFFISCYLLTKSINIVSCHSMLSLQQIEYYFSGIRSKGGRPTMNGILCNLQIPHFTFICAFIIYLCNWPIFVLSLQWLTAWLGKIWVHWLWPLDTVY